jgi:tetratricopeptide (TPR) repeat protein
MKKFIVIVFSILLCALISMSAISLVQAYNWPASLPELTWLPPYIEKGYDSHYDTNVVIYKDGSTAKLTVPVYNNAYLNGLNVSKVIISFDWGKNKTLDLSANIKQVGWHTTEIFTVSFTADATEAVSSDWAHTYRIYVEHVNATTGPTKIVGTYWANWDDFAGTHYKFVVFSTDQADALDLSEKYVSYYSAYPSSYFTNVNASQLMGQAVIEASLGATYYTRGDYASAKTQLGKALDLYGQALTAEMEWRTKTEEAALNVTLTGAAANMTRANADMKRAEADMKRADATVNQSYAWMFFGIGFIFMGIATIVYASKKPKAA